MANANILSQRYATKPMNATFSEHGKNLAERELWLAVLKAQKELGLDIPGEDIQRFEKAKGDIDLKRIEEIERRTRHDIKAKIQAFVEVAGAGEHIHKGMTSRDLTDNVEQMQLRNASRLIFGSYVSVLRHMLDRADEYKDIVLTARTHHQPAQPTLLGHRFSMWAEELAYHLGNFEHFIEGYPLRGIKGPVGTQFDMLTLLGSSEKVKALEKKVSDHLGFSKVLKSPGQVYFRSLDFAMTSHLAELTAACANFGLGMRLMAGYELVTEGFKEGQTGSTAMPHKMNTRSSERICGMAENIKMFNDGSSRISGNQWEEGDVYCSTPRRVIGANSFYASDALCETTLTVLKEMGAYPQVISQEVDLYLQFLATTEILMRAVQGGAGREQAHAKIKEYAVAEALNRRQTGAEPDIISKLVDGEMFIEAGITEDQLRAGFEDKKHFVGRAGSQIEEVIQDGQYFIKKYPDQAAYEPGDIL